MLSNHQYIAKSLTPSELARLYGVSVKTFKAWTDLHIEKIGKRVTKYFTPLQVKIIFECLGFPSLVFND